MTRKLALALFAALALPASAEIKPGTFSSKSLGKEVAYVVDLPASYASGDKKYPVIYLLHGLFESSSFYERRGLQPAFAAAREKGDLPEAIVAVADASNSFYVNGPAGAFQDISSDKASILGGLAQTMLAAGTDRASPRAAGAA